MLCPNNHLSPLFLSFFLTYIFLNLFLLAVFPKYVLQSFKNSSRVHSASCSVGTGGGGGFPLGKTSRALSWPLTSSRIEVRNEWSGKSTPTYTFMAGTLTASLYLFLLSWILRFSSCAMHSSPFSPVALYLVTQWLCFTYGMFRFKVDDVTVVGNNRTLPRHCPKHVSGDYTNLQKRSVSIHDSLAGFRTFN
jgi:hypothetical protein